MSVLELKAQIIEELDHVSVDILLEIKEFLDSSHSAIPESVLESIKISRQQLNEGKGIPHEEVMKMAKEWLKK
jgi:hypothetical protein